MYELNINGASHRVDAPADMPLLWVLRDLLGLTGTKYGCGIAQCGACTVLIDGVAQRSCVLPVSAVGDGAITTIEGLDGKVGRAVQSAWEALSVPQCGFCQSGQILAATSLLTNNPTPSDAQIAEGMSGNICRCCTYVRIGKAVRKAADDLTQGAVR
ncbi:MAG: (2Fe-2S)-binding protein [Chromatiales bacterium]|nr:(2Fe-2S)-binding protein [Chromatiales bacterium]